MKNSRTASRQLSSVKRIPFALACALVAFSALACARADGAVDVTYAFIAPQTQTQQSQLSGEWVAELKPSKPGAINFTFHRRSEGGGFSMTGDWLPLSELQGLSADAATTARTNVTFNIVREAGTFQCEGYFREGKGAGFWTLTPSRNFIAAMRTRGYDRLSDEDLLRAALHNLTTKYVDELKAAGYDRLSFQELNRAVTHDVTAQYIREMAAAGYQGLTIEELVRARNHDVDADYVKQVRAMGFDRQPLETLIRLRNHEITQEFINQMRSIGFDNLSIEELIRLKNHEITAEFVNGLKEEGYAPIDAETAVRLKNHDIDRDYIRRVKAKGFTGLSLDQLIRLRNNDIIQ